MSFWGRLLHLLGLRPNPVPRTYHYEIGGTLQDTLDQVSRHERRSLDTVASDLLVAGLNEYQERELSLLGWKSLSPPEQDAVALACLGYTSREIAARLIKSRSTIQGQLNNAYKKLGVKNRVELHALFLDWDFSAWGPAAED